MNLKIAATFSLSVEAVTSTFAICAIRGAGKSHTASVMAEEMLKAGQPIVAYDPTGAWWGLKSSADGKRPGFPVVIFGGEHADVPLEETAGETIALTIVEKRIPAILDCSLLRKGARVRFMTSFCETLYHKNREPLHLFLDEVQTVAPQNIHQMPDAARCLGAVEDIILQGRRRGLGLTAIGPRPASINTNIRSACQTLIAMRIGSGKHDRKAINEWIEAHGDPETAKEMLATLASLPKGDGWIWNPADDVFRLVHFRPRETFDSSATPKIGHRVIQPQQMAKIDLDALGEAIRATVAKAKADDPAELRKQITKLQLQLTALQAKPAVAPAVTIERVEVPIFRENELERMENLVIDMKGFSQGIEIANREAARLVQIASGKEARIKASHPLPAPADDRLFKPIGAIQRTERKLGLIPDPPKRFRGNGAPPGNVSIGMPRMHRAFLTALAQHPRGLTKPQILLHANYASSGPTSKAFADFSREGWWQDAGSVFTITEEGLESLGDWEPLPTGAELRAQLIRQAGPMEAAILQVLFDAYPGVIGKGKILERAQYASSGPTSKVFARLVRIGYAEKLAAGHLRAADELFE